MGVPGTPFLRELNWKRALTTGLASSSSIAIANFEAEDTILEILEVTGAGAGTVTGIRVLIGGDLSTDVMNVVTQGDGWIQLDGDCDGDHLLIAWHDANPV